MITNIKFCNVEDLEEVTGLTHDELWDNGFNLDDCDAIMILDQEELPLHIVQDSFGYRNWEPCDDIWSLYYDNKINPAVYDILNSWENYCVGCHYTNYKGKVYVSKHHS